MLDLDDNLMMFLELDGDEVHTMIIGFAQYQPELFRHICLAIQCQMAMDLLNEMREETIDGFVDGYPMYPELQLDDD